MSASDLYQFSVYGVLADVQHDGPSKAAVADSADQQDSDSPNGMHSPPNGNGVCCSKEGICSQQVIREQGTSNSTPESENPSDKRLSSEKVGPTLLMKNIHLHYLHGYLDQN